MKIRDVETLDNYLHEELAWRKKELSNILLMLKDIDSKTSSKSRNIYKKYYLRSGIVLLYAHWEGFVKNTGRAYLNYVSYKGLAYTSLTPNFIALGLRGTIKIAGLSNKPSKHNDLVNFFLDGMLDKPNIKYDDVIDTNDNLNLDLFTEITILLGIDMDINDYSLLEKLIDKKLLSARNAIAHGENYESIDTSDYKELHDKVLEILELFKNNVSNAAVLESYRVSK